MSVDKKQKDKDWQEINDLINNLSKITNQKIKVSQQNVNMYVVVANQREIKDLIDEIGLQRPEFDPKKNTNNYSASQRHTLHGNDFDEF